MVRQPSWQRIILLFVLGYEAAGGLSGGGLLVAARDGRLMSMPVGAMHGFFPDFFIPGLILLGMGILNLAAFGAVWRRRRYDWLLAGLALGGFTVWFLVEIAVLGQFVWLHVMWGLPVLVGGFMALPLIPSGSGGSFVKSHPVLTYYLLAFGISWGGILLVIGSQGGLPATHEQFAQQLAFAIPAMFVGPSAAGLLMTGFVSGQTGFRELFARLGQWRVAACWYAMALLTAPVVFAVVQAALSENSTVFLPGLLTTGDKAPFVMMGMVAALVNAFFEELGWTGFAIPQLRLRHGVLATGLIAGELWAAWHIFAIRVWPGVTLTGGLPLAPFLVVAGVFVLVGQLPAYRVLMLWVYDHTEGSLLLAVLMHASLDAATFILGPASISGTDLLVYDVALGAAWWLVVGALILATRGHLARQRVQAQAAPGQPARTAA